MERFSEKIKQALYKFFMLDKFEFSEVIFERVVVENICEFAKNLHPKEFVAVIGGRVESKKLLITDVYYQPFVSSTHSASFSSFLPNAVQGVGTVHSHPSSNNHPSRNDLLFFSKKGMVHFIIGYPYNEENVAGYDFNGNEIKFRVE